MKKHFLLKWNHLFFASLLLGGLFLITACGDDDDPIIEPPRVDPPTAAFSAGTVNGLTITFVNASVGADSYAWDFGDGNTSTEREPTHTYAAEGTYTVKLTVTNSAGSNESTIDVTVVEPDKLKSFIVGKAWQAQRGSTLAYGLGPNDGSWSWDDVDGDGNKALAPWFSWGDLEGATPLALREAATNDIYTFNEDGTYNVDFNGDFWAEFGIWAGTDFNEVNIDISSGMLPPNTNGDDVSAFIAGTWDYSIDEMASTISVIGAGAHIMNPRYKNGQSSYDAGEGITYDIVHTEEGSDRDLLILGSSTHDNDFNSDPIQYIYLASYKGAVPDLVAVEPGGWQPVDFAPEISASTISHVFDAEGNFGEGVDEVVSSSIVEYGIEIDGVTATKFTRTDADGGFTDLKLYSRDSDIRFDADGTYDYSIAQVNVYIPSSNTFVEGGLQNQLEVILADESGDDNGANGGPGFWCCWVIESQTDIALDQWVTLKFDFTGDLDEPEAQWGIRDDMDLVILRFGGSGHPGGGDIYYSDFKFVKE